MRTCEDDVSPADHRQKPPFMTPEFCQEVVG